MDRTIVVSLGGHARPYRLEADAYDLLARYLDRAAARLPQDPDRAEVLGDLERSVGDKLDMLLGTEDRVVTAAEIGAILDEIGTVDTGQDAGPDEAPSRPAGRWLRRIREGQQLAGVCTGLAVYAEMDVTWVRTLFVLATLVTAGIFALVYLVLVAVLPVASTATSPAHPRERLHRVREGKQISGVCAGIAAYTELNVDWVRAVFVLATLGTAGGFLLVYIALAFIVPFGTPRIVPQH